MATSLYQTECVIALRPSWVKAWDFEQALIRCGDALGAAFTSVVIQFPARCRIWIDVAIRLLSFCNQVVATNRRLRLEFQGGMDGVLGYLNRMGFFHQLDGAAEVAPYRPTISGTPLQRGSNKGLVEIERIEASESAQRDVILRLGEAVERGCAARVDVKQATYAVKTIFSELIGNVVEHSDTKLQAFAALQTYTGGNSLTIAVSDGGLGLMETLRPALAKRNSPLASLSEVDLLVQIFREGVSRHEDDKRGTGLKLCASSAIRFQADLDVRLARQRVQLRPGKTSYEPNLAYTQDYLPLLGGTHIALTLNLT